MTDQKPPDKDELITLAQSAERYGFTHLYLRELARKGRMKAKKVGSIWLTTPADVEKFIRSRKRRGAYRDDIQA